MDSDEEYEHSSREKFKRERHDVKNNIKVERRSPKLTRSRDEGKSSSKRGFSSNNNDEELYKKKPNYREKDRESYRDKDSYRDNDRDKESSYRMKESYKFNPPRDNKNFEYQDSKPHWGDNFKEKENFRNRNNYRDNNFRPNYGRERNASFKERGGDSSFREPPQDKGFRDSDNFNMKRKRYSSPFYENNSPPFIKRPRRDWDNTREHEVGGYEANNGYMGPPPPLEDLNGSFTSSRDMNCQPPMMPFKQFMASLDDSVDDQEAVKKYNDYKLEFKKQQISEFFLNHKEEEWFKVKYHPTDSLKTQVQHQQAVLNRKDVFFDLCQKGWLQDFSLDAQHSNQIINFFDAVVVKLEGGTDADMAIFDPSIVKHIKEEVPEEVAKESTMGDEMAKEPQEEIAVKDKVCHDEAPTGLSELGECREETTSQLSEEEDGRCIKNPPEMESINQADEEKTFSKDEAEESSLLKIKEEDSRRECSEANSAKSSRASSNFGVENKDEGVGGSECKESSSDREGLSDDEKNPDENDKNIEEVEEYQREVGMKHLNGEEDGGVNLEKNEEKERKDSERGEDNKKRELSDGEFNSDTGSEIEDSPLSPEPDVEIASKDPSDTETNAQEGGSVPELPQPREMLHKTQSIFLRNLPPNVTKLEIENLCKDIPGFLRVAITDPQPERKFFRRGWVTFKASADIKKICADLTYIKVS